METTSPLTQPLPAPDAEDAPTTGHKSARSARVELITRGERRRVWTPEQKREIVMESLGSALTPTEVARKYAITTGLLYTWRRQVLGGQMTGLVRSTPGFAQVKVVPPHLEAPEPIAEPPIVPPEAVVVPRPQGLIEIVLLDGVTVRVNAHALRRVLDAVAGRGSPCRLGCGSTWLAAPRICARAWPGLPCWCSKDWARTRSTGRFTPSVVAVPG